MSQRIRDLAKLAAIIACYLVASYFDDEELRRQEADAAWRTAQLVHSTTGGR